MRKLRKKVKRRKPIRQRKRRFQKRRKLSRRQLEREFERVVAEERKQRARAEQAEAQVISILSPAPESFTERQYRLRISFKMETAGLLPRRGESMREALERWAERNGFSSQEMWEEYRRIHGRGRHLRRAA